MEEFDPTTQMPSEDVHALTYNPYRFSNFVLAEHPHSKVDYARLVHFTESGVQAWGIDESPNAPETKVQECHTSS